MSHLAELRDQVVDANGNIYQVSTAYSAAYETIGTLTIKHDKNGNELWRHFNPTLELATSMAVDASGNVYYAGAWTSLYAVALGYCPGCCKLFLKWMLS